MNVQLNFGSVPFNFFILFSVNDSSLEFTAEVSAYTGEIDAVELHYNINGNWDSTEMEQQNNSTTYTASVSDIYDGMLVKYYLLAVNSEGVVQTYPSNAPDNNIVFKKGTPRKLRNIKGRVLSLLTGGAGNNNYWHWLFDVLPRFRLCKKNFNIDKKHSILLPKIQEKFQIS